MEVSSTVSRRRFRNKSSIMDLLKEQLQSGMSVKSFCAGRDIAEGTFYNWKKRYSKEEKIIDASAFASLHIDTEVREGLFAEVKGIRIYQPVSAG